MITEEKTVIDGLVRSYENEITMHYLNFLQDSGMSWDACCRALFRPVDSYDQNFLVEEASKIRAELELSPGEGPERLADLVQFQAQLERRLVRACPDGFPDWDAIGLPDASPLESYGEENEKIIAIEDQIRHTMLEEWRSASTKPTSF